MVTVTLGVAMFTFVIVSLVGLLMAARRQLVATGEVTITVNGDADKAVCVPRPAAPCWARWPTTGCSFPRPAAAREAAASAR